MNKSAAVVAIVAALSMSAAWALDPPKPAQAAKPSTPSTKPRTIEWDELIPAEERDKPFIPEQQVTPLFDDESGPAAVQSGSSAVNKKLDGQLVRIPGYVVPVEVVDKRLVKTFLLVPYFGACIHVPPPPPNQMIFVEAATAFPLSSMYDPVWVAGKITTQGATTGMADTSYSLKSMSIEKYEDPP